MKKKELKKKKMLLEKQAKETDVLKDSTEADDEPNVTEEAETPEVAPTQAKKHKLENEETAEDAPVKKKKKKKDKAMNGDVVDKSKEKPVTEENGANGEEVDGDTEAEKVVPKPSKKNSKSEDEKDNTSLLPGSAISLGILSDKSFQSLSSHVSE